MNAKRIQLPLDDQAISDLRAGDRVLLAGTVYTARDAAHKRMVEGLAKDVPPPFELKGATVYYCGPSPAPRGKPIGSAGPTTSSRMDCYVEALVAQGVKAFIGKGARSPDVARVLQEAKAIYFAAVGGLGALLSLTIRGAEVVAYPDLGPEAVYRLDVEDFPAVVAIDIYGGDAYREAVSHYRAFVPGKSQGSA